MKFAIAALLIFSGVILSSSYTTEDKMTITISGLRSNKGQVLISIFKGSDGYPDKPEKAFKKLQLKVVDKTASIDVFPLPAGDYAIAVLHDENKDGKMNTNWIGFPKEGFGFSNNVMGTFGPPSFSKARITYNGGQLHTNIRTKYF